MLEFVTVCMEVYEAGKGAFKVQCFRFKLCPVTTITKVVRIREHKSPVIRTMLLSITLRLFPPLVQSIYCRIYHEGHIENTSNTL